MAKFDKATIDAEYAADKRRYLLGRLRAHLDGECPQCSALPERIGVPYYDAAGEERHHGADTFAASEHFPYRCGGTLRLCLGEDPTIEVVRACPTRQANNLQVLCDEFEDEAADDAMAIADALDLGEEAEEETPGDRALADAEAQAERDAW